ncbi:MAG: transposase [Planctomycetaceae bacterium]
MEHRTLDPAADIHKTRHRLPHWEQAGTYAFITFRTADSLPRAARDAWADERDRWLWSRGIDATAGVSTTAVGSLSAADRRELASRCSEFWQRQLDAGHGPCLLRMSPLRSVVAAVIRRLDGIRYDVEAFVVMPNHVHVLVGLGGIGSLRRECREWKHLSARGINALLGRRGAFWQAESWDHLVRTPESMHRIRGYIEANPGRAGLGPDEYTLHVRGPAR